MSFEIRQRDYRDYEININDRVRFTDEYGDTRTGVVSGRGFAGNYIEIESGGQTFCGYSSDMSLQKIF